MQLVPRPGAVSFKRLLGAIFFEERIANLDGAHDVSLAKDASSTMEPNLERIRPHPANRYDGATPRTSWGATVVGIHNEHVSGLAGRRGTAAEQSDLCAEIGGRSAVPLEDDRLELIVG